MSVLALLREVSSGLRDCELSFVDRIQIDVGLAVRQHEAYANALRQLGCDVLTLPARPELPDSVFVEDTAIVFKEVAVLTRPGAPARRAEVASVADALATYRPLVSLLEPATLDGGDVLVLGGEVHVGNSARSNPEGIRQLGELLTPWGYRVRGVATRDCLHLKSAVTQVADDCLLVQPRWVDCTPFAGWRIIEVHPSEPHGANALRIGDSVVYPSCFPHTRERLEAAGIAVCAVDVSELQKAEGAVTCCSLIVELTADQSLRGATSVR